MRLLRAIGYGLYMGLVHGIATYRGHKLIEVVKGPDYSNWQLWSEDLTFRYTHRNLHCTDADAALTSSDWGDYPDNSPENAGKSRWEYGVNGWPDDAYDVLRVPHPASR